MYAKAPGNAGKRDGCILMILLGYLQTKFGDKILMYLAKTIKSISYFFVIASIFSSAFDCSISFTVANGIFAFFARGPSVFSVPMITIISPFNWFFALASRRS